MKFAYDHYLRVGIDATEKMTEKMPDSDIWYTTEIPTGPGVEKTFTMPWSIRNMTIWDDDLDKPLGNLHMHPDGFWAFEPIIEEDS